MQNIFCPGAGSSSSIIDEAFGLSGAGDEEEETERERLIKIGLITPFESGLYDTCSSTSSSISPPVQGGVSIEGKGLLALTGVYWH